MWGGIKIIVVAGIFEVDLCCVRQEEKSRSAVIELYDLTKNFFPGDETEKFQQASRMIEAGKLKNKVLTFSFPKHIRESRGFEKAYSTKLVMGAPTRLYAELISTNIKK